MNVTQSFARQPFLGSAPCYLYWKLQFKYIFCILQQLMPDELKQSKNFLFLSHKSCLISLLCNTFFKSYYILIINVGIGLAG